MSYIDDSVASTMRWEGAIPWMYLDTRGNVTAACGILLADAGAACALPFMHQGGARAAEEDIVAEFQRVKALPSAKEAGFYHSESSPTLARADMASLLNIQTRANDASLRAVFQGWDAYPDQAKQGLLDMEYNIGEGELLRGYPKMDADIRALNWMAVAGHCHRNGISPARNEWAKELFLAAAAAKQAA